MLSSKKVILRDERSDTDIRYLSAEINQDGDLVFEGQDLGKGVEGVFGCSEYEWWWSVKAEDISLFEKAMGCTGKLLKNIELKFSNENAANLYEFMQANEIPFETSSRIGD